ncbi:host specificity protein J [Rodentibacter pneumotropicus]|uniref:host specificity protein J n=2 Tax=Rodentibacter pneumotropicus TaxID=758 RepID=UPI00109D5F9A|nr:phage tail protein [Rodentibacter pneumotropicus]THA07309.1 host specificity protein J [Rodentibacter pneumotropicus]
MGKGGGGGGRTPVEAKESGRSKQLVKIVEIISEGEIEGLADGMKSVYLDNTPIQNTDGSYNFSNVQLEGRVGSQVQEIIPGFNTSEKEVNVGTQVRKATPITRTVTDSKVSRLRLTLGVQSLFSQNDQGDTNGASVSLTVYIGNQSYPITISGKYSSQYLQQHTFSNLPAVPFTVRVERNTADSKSQRLQNNTVWASYTEIIDTEFTYPNTALIGVKFDSEYFSNIPNRTYDVKGIKVKVPSNYNPQTRQYRGMWDGTFKIDWSDNPAWVLYDIVTNKRYGLGQRLGDFGADKWALYQVAQYCDQLVPDGFGGKEPRFTCNAWLTDQRPAYDVINDICSIFRAMPVWNGRELTVVMDRPADPVWTYTNANVENGEFTYTFSAKKARHNAIQVEYADKDNAYEKTIEYVSDDDAIRKNGLNVKKITAFGCTSRGQAHRTGLWLLQTEKLETKTVTFTVGAEGLMHVPGDIIKVADIDYAGTNIGGRALKIVGKKVTLDREINITANSYFTYINAQAKHQDIKILSVNGAEITLDSEPVGLAEYGVWSLTTQRINAQLFRALSVKEDAKGKYTIVALQHEPQKEAIVDNGAIFEPKSTSILSVPKVNDIQIITNPDGSIGINADVSGGNGLVKYDILIYKGDNLFDVRLGLKSPELDLSNLANGEYLVVIRARNEKGQLLNERTQRFTIDRPTAPTGVRATGGLGNITLEWDWINDATATEIFASETDDIKTAKRITKVTARMYSHEVGAKQVRYYWLRHTRGINVGPFHQQSGLRAESAVDIDAELELLNEKLSQNIVNEVIDTALPARNLELIQTVTGLDVNTFIGYKQVHNTADGKLYTWNGSKYLDNSVDVAKLQIPTKQLTGTLTAQQIGANVIGTQHLGANTITADKMAADSVSTAALQAGAVRASHVAAGELTADKMAIGLGGNLLYNPIFANNGNGWSMYVDGNNIDNADWGFNNTTGAYQGGAYLPTELKFRWQRNRKNTNSGNVRLGGLYQDLKLVKDKYYCFSAYVGAHRAFIDLNIEHGSTQLIKKSWSGRGKSGGYGNNNSDTGIEENLRIYMIFKATGDNATYRMIINMWADGTQDSPALLIRRPMLEECLPTTKEPNTWQNAGVTAIHGGSIVSKTVTTEQLAAGSVTANEIAAGVIGARHVAAKSLNANHIASKSLTSELINVSNLAAISANLGRVTAGTITGTTIEGNNIRGGSVRGTTMSGSIIEGGTIRGARIEGVTGEFTGSLKISQLVGGNIYETLLVDNWKKLDRKVTFTTKDSTGMSRSNTYYAFEAKINILSSSAKRWVQVPFNITTSDYSHMGSNQNLTLYRRGNLSHLANGSLSKITNTSLILNENQQLNIKLLAWASNENSLDKPLITTILYSNSRLLVKV